MRSKAREVIISLTLILLTVTVLLHIGGTKASAADSDLIVTRTDFLRALDNANEGEVLYVGDIDFNLEGSGAVNEFERVIISKSITVKNGKSSGKAVFTGASFDIDGSKIAGARSKVNFEGIIFDEDCSFNRNTANRHYGGAQPSSAHFPYYSLCIQLRERERIRL